jgi:phosphatidylserine/phosphatidylglycerophosphate/cardiolipin synthase-like enzyme
VALSRTEPRLPPLRSPVEEILRLYEDAVASAERFIYIENQYLSSRDFLRALVSRMRDRSRPRLDIVLLLPRRLPSPLEAATLDPLRLRLLDELADEARRTGHHVGVFHPTAIDGDAGDVGVVLHSKLMIVDDRLLSVGSANLINRSMGLDTELNVSWEAGPEDAALADSIRAVRVDLLAEHCGLSREVRGGHGLENGEGMVGRLDALASNGSCRLRRLTRETILQGGLESLARWGVFFDPRNGEEIPFPTR